MHELEFVTSQKLAGLLWKLGTFRSQSKVVVEAPMRVAVGRSRRVSVD